MSHGVHWGLILILILKSYSSSFRREFFEFHTHTQHTHTHTYTYHLSFHPSTTTITTTHDGPTSSHSIPACPAHAAKVIYSYSHSNHLHSRYTYTPFGWPSCQAERVQLEVPFLFTPSPISLFLYLLSILALRGIGGLRRARRSPTVSRRP